MTRLHWPRLLLLPFILVVLCCASIADAKSSVGSAHAHITVKDDFGRDVTVRYPPQRIVSLAPGPTAMLVAAGGGSQLIATIEYSGQTAAESRLPKIGNADAIDMERLIALRPDVVLVWPDGNNPAQIATIERLGIPVYRQETVTLDGIADSIRRLGKLSGTGAVADREASALQAKLARLRRQYGNVSRPPTVLLEVWGSADLHGGWPRTDERRLAGLRRTQRIRRPAAARSSHRGGGGARPQP